MSRSVTDPPPPPPPAPIDGGSRLCLACRLCSDGSLFDFARLRPDEIDQAAAQGMAPVRTATDTRFALPCPRLGAGGCEVYPDRPSVCRAFECELLKSVNRGERVLAEALPLVTEAQRLRDIADAAAPTEDRAHARRRWLAMSERPHDAPPDPALALAMTSLNLFLDRHFRRPAERLLSASAVHLDSNDM